MAARHRGAGETRDTTGRFTARHITMTGATATVPRGPRSLATLAAAMLATLLIAVVAALPASAVQWDGMATMKHYAYVTTDEDLVVTSAIRA